ncbi:MAG: magnesium transporter [Halothiobacillaceae bacterium]
MANKHKVRYQELLRIIHDVHETLRRNRVTEQLVRRQQDMPQQELVGSIVHRQNMARLAHQLERLHSADIAVLLEALPLAERLVVWELVQADQDGEVLLEVSDAVRESLIEAMDQDEIRQAATGLSADELADLAPDIPEQIMEDVLNALPSEEGWRLKLAMSCPDDSVGALMDFDQITVREDVSIEAVLRYLRRFTALPNHTDKLFVTDREGIFRGLIHLKTLLVNNPETPIAEVMTREAHAFRPLDTARDASDTFERYDLISAPVIDENNRLIGRITVDEIVHHMHESSEEAHLSRGGLREEEDLFAPVRKSVRNRAPWLAVNLVTALVASRVIGLFEGSIEQLVALAALMPIVAGMGGNVGNQTITMIVRELAFRHLERRDVMVLYFKELRIAAINGLIWGGVLALVTYLLYQDMPLGLVMLAAVTLNFLVAALFGVTIPVVRAHLGRDPALGSSVLITAITDSGGFFIFLGLATVFLL